MYVHTLTYNQKHDLTVEKIYLQYLHKLRIYYL